MNMDNFHINKYTFLFLKCTYSSRHKLAPQVYLLPYLYGINLLLKFIPLQLSILHPHGLHHSACFLVHSLTKTVSSTTSTITSRHKPSVYPSPSQHILHPHSNPPLRMTYVVTTNAFSILHPHGLHHSACLLVHSLTHTASSTTSTIMSRHKPSVYPSPSQHILHPYSNPPLCMPYVVTSSSS
ncbi:hypothetical protein F2Q70_00019885 [Brassica cretica]|uniref:Uncharacterized protein n=1 Tax=Brassica cretica TaxID=69181 RepID=A0A8S9GTZ2_BRACR|nr:hypothetical protein F2Q70_00019885 [Brassica cretica]